MALARLNRPAPLASADLERLRSACGRQRVDLTASLFGSRSVTWRVNREAVLLLGGGRALLLQVAHPLVAAGVAAHSTFRTDPLQRLWRTLDLTLTVTFGDAAHAIRAIRAIEQRHARVRGALTTAVGPFPRGTPYDANDPELLFWVHATLVDSALLVYERFIAPLSARARSAYYNEAKIAARLFGIPENLIPPTLRAFHNYMETMVQSDTLTVGAAGKEIAASILKPPLPIGLRQTLQTMNLFTVGLLPPVVRERYGLPWSRLQDAALHTIAKSAKHLVPLLPDLLRAFPHARRASLRSARPSA